MFTNKYMNFFYLHKTRYKHTENNSKSVQIFLKMKLNRKKKKEQIKICSKFKSKKVKNFDEKIKKKK